MLSRNTMQRYSFIRHAWHALQGHRKWKPVWRTATLKKTYDIVIIGGGGHGLATAYNLAAHHGIRNIAVIERGWIGGGNTGRNTQVTRSNYFWPESSAFFDHSLKLFETLSHELNFNVMLSQRGQIILAHSYHELDMIRRWTNAIKINQVDSELLSPDEIKSIEPQININARYPIHGGFIQRRGGISRHDAVVWGYARAASDLGVDIIEQCEVTGFEIANNRINSILSTKGRIQAEKVCVAVAGHSSQLAAMAGFRLPIRSMALQAMVTEPVKPCLNTAVLSPVIHMYVSQSDRGEIVIGGGADGYVSYAQRGGLPALEADISAVVELFPAFRRLRLMRQWAGVVDVSSDTSPIMGKTPISNLYISCGWGTGGYKAIPAGGETMAYSIVNDRMHPLISRFGLDRFSTGELVYEKAASGVLH